MTRMMPRAVADSIVLHIAKKLFEAVQEEFPREKEVSFFDLSKEDQEPYIHCVKKVFVLDKSLRNCFHME